jgi:transposase
LEQAETSGLPKFAACAASLQRDRAVVEAALQLVWNNGQTEGQMTKLKLVKRSMYGRAKFDLLRQRVLDRAA